MKTLVSLSHVFRISQRVAEIVERDRKLGFDAQRVSVCFDCFRVAPLVVQSPPDYHPVYIIMAIGAGSITGGWMNDSGFWVYRTMTGLTEVEALKTKSVSLIALGLTGLAAAWLLSELVPLV